MNEELQQAALEGIEELSGGRIDILKLYNLLLHLKTLSDKRNTILTHYMSAVSGLPRNNVMKEDFQKALFFESITKTNNILHEMAAQVDAYFDTEGLDYDAQDFDNEDDVNDED